MKRRASNCEKYGSRAGESDRADVMAANVVSAITNVRSRCLFFNIFHTCFPFITSRPNPSSLKSDGSHHNRTLSPLLFGHYHQKPDIQVLINNFFTKSFPMLSKTKSRTAGKRSNLFYNHWVAKYYRLVRKHNKLLASPLQKLTATFLRKRKSLQHKLESLAARLTHMQSALKMGAAAGIFAAATLFNTADAQIQFGLAGNPLAFSKDADKSAFTDIDGDGDMDLFACDDNGKPLFFKNTGTPAFLKYF